MSRILPFKIVLLGESSVGKSSLALRFVKDTYDDYRESTTVALDATTSIKFEIWDTAGQERYKSLAPMYYRHAAAAIIVYDISSTTSLKRAKDWVNELKRQADGSLVIALVGNKLDLEDQRQVSIDDAKSFALEHGLLWSEASAKSGQGVTEIFQTIATKLPLDAVRRPSARLQPPTPQAQRATCC